MMGQPLNARLEHEPPKRPSSSQRTANIASKYKAQPAAEGAPDPANCPPPEPEAIGPFVRDQTGTTFVVAALVMRPWFEAQAQLVRMMNYLMPPMPLPLPGYRPPLAGGAAPPAWEQLLNPLQLPISGLHQSPESDLAERRSCYELSVDLPGVSPDEIQVRCGPGVIVVIGERREDSEAERLGLALAERRFGRFERTFPLPGDADACHAQASYQAGVLRIRAPKLNAGEDGLIQVPIGH